MNLRATLLRIMRVPPKPHLPAEDPSTVRTFNAAPQFLTYRRVSWFLKQAAAFVGLVAGLFFLREIPDLAQGRVRIGFWLVPDWLMRNLFVIFETFAWTGFVTQAVGSFLLLRLDWEQRWYLISDRSLRVREGIVRLHEKTTTFANIQNVSIRQGPIQRWFGIADVEVKSAGGGGRKEGEGGEDLHTVTLQGLADAADVRDTILDRARRPALMGVAVQASAATDRTLDPTTPDLEPTASGPAHAHATMSAPADADTTPSIAAPAHATAPIAAPRTSAAPHTSLAPRTSTDPRTSPSPHTSTPPHPTSTPANQGADLASAAIELLEECRALRRRIP